MSFFLKMIFVITLILIILYGIIYRQTQKNSLLKKIYSGVIWSKNYKTISKKSLPSEYYKASTEKIFSKNYIESNIKNTGVIWLRNSSNSKENDVITFIRHIVNLDSFEKKEFTLITTDGDNSFPDSAINAIKKEALLKFLNNKYLLSWYTQNYDGSLVHPKLKPIPIGFDLHTVFDSSVSNGKKGLSKMFKIYNIQLINLINKNQRIFSILVDGMANSHPERTDVLKKIETIDNKNFFIKKKKLSRGELFENYCKYTFGLSPRGNGIDCHRTWEMLFFGMIPIIKKSSIDSLYLNLPVLLVDSYDDLEKINYTEKYNELKKLLPVPKKIFLLNYWLK